MAAYGTVTVANKDGVAADQVKWGFAFDDDATSSSIQSAILAWMSDFFTHDYGTGNLLQILTPNLAWTGVLLQVYNLAGHLDGSPHGSPVAFVVDDWSATVPANTAVANQIAAVLAYHSSVYSSTPVAGPSGSIPTPESAQDMGAPATHTGTTKLRSRQGGRLYLGPLASQVITQDGNGNPILGTPHIGQISAAATGGEAGGSHDGGLHWSVWSRRNAALAHVTAGWVDHCIKTRRRREFVNHLRTTW